ncbi:MAG: hypothetical protein EHM21_11750 [Chloroflexi bacterium]|nr:MAG: hypothetical protein EHM21_11750 [Chloroflexota bacterium]
MPTFRYQTKGNWYKGNTHLHSTASDGWKTFPELEQMYQDAGYQFLFRTDHWVASNVNGAAQDNSLLWLDGVELDGRDASGSAFHVVALGTFQDIHVKMGLDQALHSVRDQNGLLILAHPQWTGNSFEDARRWQFDGVEVYNNVTRWLNGKGDGSAYWNAMLERFPNTLALAVDDAHLGPNEAGIWNGGWVVVNAPECTREAVLSALRAGNYYSSCGPEIYSIETDGENIRFECSPVQFARMVGPAWSGDRTGAYGANSVTGGAFKLPRNWAYIYLEIEDAQGRRAWSNPLFVQE